MQAIGKYALTKEEIEANNRFYSSLIERFGDSPESVGWCSNRTQEKRFEVLLEIEHLIPLRVAEARILDVGCGLGHLYRYLMRQKGGCVDYLGIDINPRAIAQAQKLNPGVKFRRCDILREEVEKFNLVFASGAMTFRVKDNEEFMRAMIERMYDLADVGVAFNFLNNKDYLLGVYLYRYDEAEIMNFCQERFGAEAMVCLRSDYLFDDSTIYIVRKPSNPNTGGL